MKSNTLQFTSNKISEITFNSILKFLHRISIVSFMVWTLFIIIGDHLIKYLIYAVLSLYIFIAISYVNQMKKNGINEDKITQQVVGIVLGTVLLIVIIAGLFKMYSAISGII